MGFYSWMRDRQIADVAVSQTWRPDRCDRIALVLQGGGALGAYQVGVYQALHEAGLEPNWVCGVSIGGINSAIIAGNPPEERLEKLQMFWERITARKVWHYTPDGDVWRKARNLHSTWLTTTLGQPGFFQPHELNPWLSPAGARTATSYYDTTPLRETLLELVDFDLINSRKMHFAVGAVNVLTGNFLYFDNNKEIIGPEHVMASGALPPALPMVKIGTDHFWDGGIVSNTPLQHLLDQDDRKNSLVFQVDLFSSRGLLPRDIQEVAARHKDIMYSSRTRYNTDVYKKMNNLKADYFKALAEDSGRQAQRRRAQDARSSRPSARHHHPADDLPAEDLRGRFQGSRILGDLDARALAERLRRHQAHADAPRLAANARRQHGHRRARRAQ